jgi:hypothetical protein
MGKVETIKQYIQETRYQPKIHEQENRSELTICLVVLILLNSCRGKETCLVSRVDVCLFRQFTPKAKRVS